MATYLIDSNTLTLYQRRHPRVVAAFRVHAGDLLAVTSVNVEEALGGYYSLLRKARTPQAEEHASTLLADTTMLLGELTVYPVTVAALARFDALVKLKLNIRHPDLKIASVALELDATVVTNNLRDFGRVPSLKVKDWTA